MHFATLDWQLTIRSCVSISFPGHCPAHNVLLHPCHQLLVFRVCHSLAPFLLQHISDGTRGSRCTLTAWTPLCFAIASWEKFSARRESNVSLWLECLHWKLNTGTFQTSVCWGYYLSIIKGKIKGKTKLCALIAYPQQTWYIFIWDPTTISLIRYSVLKLALALTAAFTMGGAMLI